MKMQDLRLQHLKMTDQKLQAYFVFCVTTNFFTSNHRLTSQNLSSNLKHHNYELNHSRVAAFTLGRLSILL